MRTSWKVGLATAAAEPVPLAIPRTKVVLPAPRSPFNKTRSPFCRRRPSSSPAASVSSGAEVSREVVVATGPQLHRFAPGADDLHLAVRREHSDGTESGASNRDFGAYTHELGLFPTSQRVFQRRAIGDEDVLGTDDAPGAREVGELLHLTHQAVRAVATAKSRHVQPSAFGEQRLQTECAAL